MFEDFNLVQALQTSPVLLIILCCSVATTAVALERAIYFWRRRGRPKEVLAAALERLRADDPREAAWLCSKSSHPMGAVASQVLQNAHLSTEGIEERLQIALSEQRLMLERNLGLLGTMGNIAPLIGLLGTVWGIMRAFHDMARTGSAGPSVVAAGVAEALFTTAAGLLVAVPAVMLYNHFVRRTGVMLTVAENDARSLRLAVESMRRETAASSRRATEAAPPAAGSAYATKPLPATRRPHVPVES